MMSLFGLLINLLCVWVNLRLGNAGVAAFNGFVAGMCFFGALDALADRRRA